MYVCMYTYWLLIHMSTQGQSYRVTIYQHVTCLPGGSVAKNLPAHARDTDSIPGLERSPGEGVTAHSSILAWEIPWMWEPGGLESMG